MTALHLVAPPPSVDVVGSTATSRLLSTLFDDALPFLPHLHHAARLRLLMELSDAAEALADGSASRRTVCFDEDATSWECTLEACGADFLVSLYECGATARVVLYDRRLAIVSFVESLTEALGEIYGDSDSSDGGQLRNRVAVRAGSLNRKLKDQSAIHRHPASSRKSVRIHGTAVGGVAISAVGTLRAGDGGSYSASQVERSDLHALLGVGKMTVRARHVQVDVPASQLIVDAERLLPCAEEVLNSWEAGRMLATRVRLSAVGLSFYRTRSDGPVEITVRAERVPPRRRPSPQVASVESLDWVKAVANFVEALCDAFCELDPTQQRNLRLLQLRRRAFQLQERSVVRDDSLTNPRPDAYRRFARGRRSMSRGMWERSGTMRFSARWVATVPGLDLRATFLCGQSVIVDSVRETACLDRNTGEVRWRSPSGPAACTASPAGLIRFRADGNLTSLSIQTGEVRFSTQLRPRTGGGAAGSVVHTEGLPKILAVTEGDRQVSAVDLLTGALRWRHTAARPGSYRLRRVGKLFLVAGGTSSLFALDVSTGEAVWRLCNRLPFSGALAVDRRSAVAISGAPACWTLHHIDPWTGQPQWSADLVEAPLAGKHPLLTSKVVVVPVGNETYAGAEAFDRKTGQSLWRHHGDLATANSAWMAFDDLIVINDGAGVLVCLDAATGRPLFNHVFAGGAPDATPRRLEPILRNGALFVPQQQVHVLRPRTGEVIGTVPPDLVPDLLRVDEMCNVYVGEESGHLAAFGTAPRLAAV